MSLIRKHRVTLYPSGIDGSATAARQLDLGRPGVIRFIKVDYGAGVPNTTDLTIKADNSSGDTLFTLTSNATDIGPVTIGLIGIDEGGAAIAATDGSSGGQPFASGLHFSVAEADNYTTNEEITIDVWVQHCAKYRVALSPAGGAGAATATQRLIIGKPGTLRILKVTYTTMPATTDLVIKRDDSTGDTIFTKADTNTTFGPFALGQPNAVDETGSVLAASDGRDGGAPFTSGLYFDVAQADAGTDGVVVELWLDL